MNQPLAIGQVAKLAGISVDGVRYYERSGLIPRASRRDSGYRTFPPATVERIRFVKSLQALGFTLADARSLLDVVDAGGDSCAGFRPRVDSVLRRVDGQLSQLRTVRRRIVGLLRDCDRASCRIERIATRVRRAPTR